MPRRFPGGAAASSSSRPASRPSGTGDRRGGGVALVAAGDRVEQAAAASRVSRRERPDLVQRRGERDDPIARPGRRSASSPTIAGQGRRLADRAAGVGPERERTPERRHGRRRAAADPPGTAIEVPRVRVGLKARVLRGGAHRELVHVRLAQDHRTGLAQAIKKANFDVTVQRVNLPAQCS